MYMNAYVAECTEYVQLKALQHRLQLSCSERICIQNFTDQRQWLGGRKASERNQGLNGAVLERLPWIGESFKLINST